MTVGDSAPLLRAFTRAGEETFSFQRLEDVVGLADRDRGFVRESADGPLPVDGEQDLDRADSRWT
ncbi:hypothetical protein N869_06860 [Cellulomonas bogoriensis 69B4 = DSM 16987]|uniref:Uncharacterized protein n=1 Tax=Cellulomonas bogoriensis 69B4 = DSM 16987 TaxID=1386082 RepID=A0A0A0C198_9CELL|nr:hypothetical protein N869_06860 [Cellulomonas bogoriensis 69B4 = DSM 16987]